MDERRRFRQETAEERETRNAEYFSVQGGLMLSLGLLALGVGIGDGDRGTITFGAFAGVLGLAAAAWNARNRSLRRRLHWITAFVALAVGGLVAAVAVGGVAMYVIAVIIAFAASPIASVFAPEDRIE